MIDHGANGNLSLFARLVLAPPLAHAAPYSLDSG
jgi:hypothetical protein